MLKWASTIVSALVLLGGLIWGYPFKALDWFATVLDVLALSALNEALINYFEKHPYFVDEMGPWVLMGVGVISLVAIYVAPPLYRARKQS